MLLYFGVDENDIPFLYHKSWTEGELMNLTCEVPVLGFFRNLSYIHIKNEENPMKEYDFLETWNRFGSETFLSFEEEKPTLISSMDNINNANCVIKVQVEQIGIYFLDKNFESEEKQRIEDGFEEACKLLNVEYFSTEEICATRPMTPRERAEVLASFRKMVAPALFKE
uniref:Uncharacterized protein n=1 Tax=Panagrolaimus sp. ES5 TaxID=591445 RepID=A0AC34FMX6_9BILA